MDKHENAKYDIKNKMQGTGIKYKSFRMCLNLNDNKLKTIRYSYKSTYMNQTIITNQKPIEAENFFKKGTQAY